MITFVNRLVEAHACMINMHIRLHTKYPLTTTMFVINNFSNHIIVKKKVLRRM